MALHFAPNPARSIFLSAALVFVAGAGQADPEPSPEKALVAAIIESATSWPSEEIEILAPYSAIFKELDYRWNENPDDKAMRARELSNLTETVPDFDLSDIWLGSHAQNNPIGDAERLYSACVRLGRDNFNLIQADIVEFQTKFGAMLDPTGDIDAYMKALEYSQTEEGAALSHKAMDRGLALPGFTQFELTLGDAPLDENTVAGLNCFVRITFQDPDRTYEPRAFLEALQEQFQTVTAFPPLDPQGQPFDVPLEDAGRWTVSSLRQGDQSEITQMVFAVAAPGTSTGGGTPAHTMIYFSFVSVLKAD